MTQALNLNSMSKEQLVALIATMNAPKERGLLFKVSAKGACSVYGMGRWPVTLYKGQWAKLLAAKDQIEAFIATNDALLSEKPAAE